MVGVAQFYTEKIVSYKKVNYNVNFILKDHHFTQICLVSKSCFFMKLPAEQVVARLVNGTSDAGRLEILFNREWSTVCNEGFGRKEAQVACRMLGFNGCVVKLFSPTCLLNKAN